LNFNDLEELRKVLAEETDCKVFYAQHSRQMPDDTYDLASVIQLVKEVRPGLPIVVDDNYTVFKVPRIGVELGASYSCFSGFKLLGPPGIGIIVGEEEAIKTIRERNYSGGGQVQGYEAMELLRSLVIAPVTMAVKLIETGIRINLMRSGADLAIDILKRAIDDVK
jgi:selenocysteine lyase/cysteine desulfurase